MTKVIIDVEAMFSDYSTPPVVGAKLLKVDTVVEFPDYYAEGLVEAELASYLEGEEETESVTVIKLAPTSISGAAKKLAKAKGVDLMKVAGTGKDDGITVSDIKDYLASDLASALNEL